VSRKLHFWDAVWDLQLAQCPCDAHFCDWLETEQIKDASIFHFGTGSHHIIGIRTAENGSNNCVLGITASPGEYESFVKLAIDRPDVEKSYKVFFGDIYQLEQRLLPQFDVVTLFHLCEFRNERNDLYGALTDLELTTMLTEQTRARRLHRFLHEVLRVRHGREGHRGLGKGTSRRKGGPLRDASRLPQDGVRRRRREVFSLRRSVCLISVDVRMLVRVRVAVQDGGMQLLLAHEQGARRQPVEHRPVMRDDDHRRGE
jgi:hypothetical protein